MYNKVEFLYRYYNHKKKHKPYLPEISPETSCPCFLSRLVTYSICSVSISVIRVIALITRGSVFASLKSLTNISSPFSLRNSFCPTKNNLMREDSAYMAFFRTAIGSCLDNKRRSNGNAPCFKADCWTTRLLFWTSKKGKISNKTSQKRVILAKPCKHGIQHAISNPL